MISIIHPSRQRPAQAIKTAIAWLSSAKHPEDIEYWLSLDNDDTSDYRGFTNIKTKASLRILCNDNKNAIQAINAAAIRTQGELLIVVSDDFTAPFHWDFALTTLLQEHKNYVVKTDDGLQPFIVTLPIMDREYYEAQGYIYHPDYQHMYSDSHMSCKAWLEGKYINLPIRFPHNHYSTGRNRKDEVNVKADSTYESGRLTFLNHYSNNFGVTEVKQELPVSSGFVNFI
jgi:hypothetical protein